MKKKTLLSFTLAIMATMWTTSMQAQEYYDLTIALVQVTWSDNKGYRRQLSMFREQFGYSVRKLYYHYWWWFA